MAAGAGQDGASHTAVLADGADASSRAGQQHGGESYPSALLPDLLSD